MRISIPILQTIRQTCTLLAVSCVFAAYGEETIIPPVDGDETRSTGCVLPPALHTGDKVALLAPSYFWSKEKVAGAVNVVRSWGLEPVLGRNVDKEYVGKYAGTPEQRLADLRWALSDPEVKAIICLRGGYGAIHMIPSLRSEELSAQPKWLVGFSDITTLHSLEVCAGVMSIHGSITALVNNPDQWSTSAMLVHDLLMGQVPRYVMPAHPFNQKGRAKGMLVGGNLCSFSPLAGSGFDFTECDDIILFIEEVGETMHNIDRLFNMLRLRGVLQRVKGIILGDFTDCDLEFTYGSVEEMLHQYLKDLPIPVACGFPGGHGKVNLPLVMGAPVTLDVDGSGATLTFDIKGEQKTIPTAEQVR